MAAYNITPLFEFGFGLSYTTFAYSQLAITPSASGSEVIFKFRVSNTGNVPGREVPQVYLGFPVGGGGSVGVKVLRGFEEVVLGVEESGDVVMRLGARDMRWVFLLVLIWS
jgi:beta-glucosidase